MQCENLMFSVEELAYSLQFENSVHEDAAMGLSLEGELVNLTDTGIRSISVDGAAVEPDRNRNVDLPMHQTMDAYLAEHLGAGLKLNEQMLTVDTADRAEADNPKPITSAAVDALLGDVHALLQTI